MATGSAISPVFYATATITLQILPASRVFGRALLRYAVLLRRKPGDRIEILPVLLHVLLLSRWAAHNALESHPPHAVSYVRSDLNPARSSSTKSFGCSHAGKWPPLSSLL